VLVILVVLRARARVLVPVLAVMRLVMDGGSGGGLMVHRTVPHRTDHRLGGRGGVGEQQQDGNGAQEAPCRRRSMHDHVER
jgi:hypothetical protein